MFSMQKKRLIGQAQKWCLIHSLRCHRDGTESVNEGMSNKNLPITSPMVTAHLLFYEASENSVIYGRIRTAYYSGFWWLIWSTFGEAFYYDANGPFGARSTPAVFQRLTHAIRVIGLKRAKCDGLFALLDNFLGVTFRRVGEFDESVPHRASKLAESFDHVSL